MIPDELTYILQILYLQPHLRNLKTSPLLNIYLPQPPPVKPGVGLADVTAGVAEGAVKEGNVSFVLSDICKQTNKQTQTNKQKQSINQTQNKQTNKQTNKQVFL